MGEIKIAIAGVGNCASSLVQGIYYYAKAEGEMVPGVMHNVLGGYKINNIKPVAAFDVDERKVGKDLNEAIFSRPNNTAVFCKDIPSTGVEVKKAPVLDGVADHMKDHPEDHTFKVSNKPAIDVAAALKESGAEILVNYMPVGSEDASRYYAQCCLDAGVAFVNCMPVFISSDPEWQKRFVSANLPVVGDDIKAQVGSTIIHRTLARLFSERGVKIERSYQLNVGGNSVTGDQEILLSVNGKTKRVEIGNFIDSYVSVYGKTRADGKDIVILRDTKHDVKCFTVNNEYDINLSRVDALIRHKISEHIYEVTLEEGRKIKITGDHNVFILDDLGGLEEVPIRQLKEKEDFVAVPNSIPLENYKEVSNINLSPYLNDLFAQGIDNGYIRVHNHPEINIPVEFPLTDELLQIVGLWLADGNYDRAGSSNIELACGHEEESIKIIENFLENLNISYSMASNGIRVRIMSKTLGKIFKLALGLSGNAYTKRAPEWIFNLSPRQIALVLRGYVSGDGGVTGKQIRWTSVSENLVRDIQTLFLAVGINSTLFKEVPRKRKDAFKSSAEHFWHGLISSKRDMELFMRKVGFFQDYKNKAGEKACRKLIRGNTHKIPNIALLKKWGIKSKNLKESPSLRAHIVLSQLHKIKNYFEREKIRKICEGDVRFLRVKKIREIKPDSIYVYDISTKPFERFICSNILVHNTDFLNMLARDRLVSKKKSKTQAVQSILPIPLEARNLHIGPSDYVPWCQDRKLGFIRLEGKKFGDVPVDIEIRLNVEDSPNSAACTIDAIRCAKLALDRGISGPLISASSYFMKSPPQQYPDPVARSMLEEYIKGERER